MVFVLRILSSSSQFQFTLCSFRPQSSSCCSLPSLQLQAHCSVHWPHCLAGTAVSRTRHCRRGGDQLQFMAVLGNMQVHKIQSTHISAITIQIVLSLIFEFVTNSNLQQFKMKMNDVLNMNISKNIIKVSISNTSEKSN